MSRPSVWAVAQRTSRAQRSSRYLPDSMPHPAKMLPSLAAHAVETFTQPGDLVLDPIARWAALAAANAEHARARGATGRAEVLVGDCRHLRSVVPADAAGQVAMILTSPPYGASTHGRVRAAGGRVRKWDHRYSADRANFAHQGLDGILAAMEAMLREAAFVLAPDGVVVLTARPWRCGGVLVDLPGHLFSTAEQRWLRAGRAERRAARRPSRRRRGAAGVVLPAQRGAQGEAAGDAPAGHRPRGRARVREGVVTDAVVVAAVAAVPPTLAAVLTFAAARASDRRAARERAAVVDQSLGTLQSSLGQVSDAVGRVEDVVTDLRERVAQLEGAQTAARSA